MQKRILGYLLLVLGITGMALAGYLFVVGTGGRMHLIEVTSFMVIGAACFFAGINNVYDPSNSYPADRMQLPADFDEISPIQQQWRTIHIAKQPSNPVREKVSA